MCELKIKILEACLSFVFLHPTPDSKNLLDFNRCRELAWTFEPFDQQRGDDSPLAESPVVDITWLSRSSFKRALGFMEFGCLFLWVEND